MRVFILCTQWLTRQFQRIGAACLVGMAALTCVDVVGRFLGHPVFGSVELVGFMAILAVGMALPYTHRERGHIGVEILVQLFSKRTQLIIELCTVVASLVLFALVTWRMILYAGTIRRSGEVSMNLEFPEYLIIYALAFCFLVFVLVLIQNIFEVIVKLRENKP